MFSSFTFSFPNHPFLKYTSIYFLSNQYKYCNKDYSVIYCCITNHTRTQQLKTTIAILFLWILLVIGLSWAVLLFHMALVGLQLSVGLTRLECLRQFGSRCWVSARRLTGAVDQNTLVVFHVFSPCSVDFS